MESLNGNSEPLGFDGLKPHLMPIVYARQQLEIDFLNDPASATDSPLPYNPIADHLAAAFMLNPESPPDIHESCGPMEVTLDELIEAGLQNLRRRAQPFSRVSGIHTICTGDFFTATHILLDDLIRNQSVVGDPVVAIP